MKAYLDSSVLMRVLLDEPKRLKSFKKISLGVSSELIRVECLRVIDRLRISASLSDTDTAALSEELHRACGTMEFIRLSPLVLGMAGQSFPTTVRTLDALHLASALLWTQSKGTDLVFLTHDNQQGTAARALGFCVDGI